MWIDGQLVARSLSLSLFCVFGVVGLEKRVGQSGDQQLEVAEDC